MTSNCISPAISGTHLNYVLQMLRNSKVARVLPRIIESAKHDRNAVLRARWLTLYFLASLHGTGQNLIAICICWHDIGERSGRSLMSSLYVKVLWVCTTDAGGMVGVIRNAACCWALPGAHQVLLWWCHGWGAITMSLHCLCVILIRAAFTFHGLAFQPMTCKFEVQNLTRNWITKDIKKLTALGVSALSFPKTFHSFFCCRFALQQGCVIVSLLGAGLIVLVVSFRHWIPTSKE
jgi:hypothetical protein